MTASADGRSSYDHTQIRQVARLLRKELTDYSGPGTLPDLTSRGKVPTAAFGNWDAAQALGRTVEQGNAQITRVYERFLNDFRSLVSALEKAADNYQSCDEEILTNIRTVGKLLHRRTSGDPAPTISTVRPME